MTGLHYALMIAVALEAAVIVVLVVAFRRINRAIEKPAPQRFVWDEPMPWMEEDRK